MNASSFMPSPSEDTVRHISEDEKRGMLQTSHIYSGDNLRYLPKLDDESVDLIYLDPPFNTGAAYEIIWGEKKERRHFDDRFGSVKKYIEWLRPRAKHLVRVLSPTGSLFFHCDPHANYAIRALLQEELGLIFQNEIIWKRTSAHSGSKKKMGSVHDTILYFVKGKTFTWNQLYQSYDDNYIKSRFTKKDGDTGKLFYDDNLTGAGITKTGESGQPWRDVNPTDKDRHWALPNKIISALGIKGTTIQDRLDELDRMGRIYWTSVKGSLPRIKRYVDDSPGVVLSDVWDDISPINSRAKERVGYPTQKPLAIMERILSMASNKGDIVLDPFCGCGTTVIASAKMFRRWIGIDLSPTACRVVADRLWRDLKMHESIQFFVRSTETDLKELEVMDSYDFQNWAVNALGGIPNPLKGADGGIDGRLLLMDAKTPKEIQEEFIYSHPSDAVIPIQVKQGKVGRPVVDAFQTAMRRGKHKMGIIIGFEFSKNVHTEIRRARREHGLTILAITIQEILDKQAA